MTSKTTTQIWTALEEAGPTGATPERLAAMAGVQLLDVRRFLKSRISSKPPVIAGLLTKGLRGQMYVLAKHAPTEPIEPPKKKGRPKKPPKAKPKAKAKPPAAPTGPREPPICSGTTGRIKEGEVGVIPRMVCARVEVLDQEEKPIPSIVGGKEVPHRAPVAMCSSPK